MKKQPPSRSGNRNAPPSRQGRGGDRGGKSHGKSHDKPHRGGSEGKSHGHGHKRGNDRSQSPRKEHARPHRREPEGEVRQRREAQEAHERGPRLRANLFGLHAVKAAFLNPERTIRAVHFTNLLEEDIGALYQEAQKLGLKRPEPEMIEKQTLDRLLPKGTVHQNIALDAVPLDDVFLQDLINQGAGKERSVIVILDQVTDPHNMGAIMRSACAFGADGIVVQSRHAPELNGVVAKTASGALEHIPVAYETNLARAIETLKEAGYFALALDERGACTVGEAPSYPKTVLVMGAEGPGLRPLIRDKCDLLVKLPTFGGFSSLNVSNAAAVALYAVVTGAGLD